MAKLPLRLLENAIFFASGDHAAWSSCEPEVPGVRSTDEPSGATRKTSQFPPASLTLAVRLPFVPRKVACAVPAITAPATATTPSAANQLRLEMYMPLASSELVLSAGNGTRRRLENGKPGGMMGRWSNCGFSDRSRRRTVADAYGWVRKSR